MPWPALLLLLLLPLAIVAYVLYRVGTQLRKVIILCVLAGLVGATLAAVLMGVV